MYPEQTSTLQIIATEATRDPERVVLTFLDTGETVNCAQTYQRTVQWAGALRHAAVGAGDAVAVMMPLTVEQHFVWLGCAWIKAYETPLNTDYRGSMLASVLGTCRARVAVVANQYLERFIELAAQLEHLKLIVVPDADEPSRQVGAIRIIGRTEFFKGTTPATDLPIPSRSDICAVVFTSGTTGPSKGVIMSWGLMGTFSGSLGPLTGDRFRIYSTWPLFHNSGKFAFNEAVRRQGQVFIRQRWQTDKFWTDVRACGATVSGVLGGVSNFLWSQPERPDDADNPLQDLLMAPVLPQFREFEKRFGVTLRSAYAQSEAGMPTLCSSPLPNHRTCGRLRPGYHIKLIDALTGQEVGNDTVGEVCVKSDDPELMFKGYLNMPEKTAEAWVDGWFKTGDGMTRDADGNYYYADRVKDSIRRRGENISSFEVENIVNAHPAVAESVAVAAKGEDGDGEVLIFVVRKPGQDVTPEALTEFLIPRMPRFMVPRFIDFVDSLPKTPSNRTRKVELRERGVTATTWDRVKAGIKIAR